MPAQNQLVLHGMSEEVLRGFPDNTFDCCVTDSPYGLGAEPDPVVLLTAWLADGESRGVGSGGFMGSKWDAFVPSPRIWREVFRVLKPGAYLLSFFGTRTYDWGVMALRLAGFEVVDKLTWVHGEGWPKGQNISKAFDKRAGAVREVVGPGKYAGREPNASGNTGSSFRDDSYVFKGDEACVDTAPSTDLAKQWDGWNTQIKPASEPIVLCRKPLDGTFIQNVEKWGVGGLNVGACSVKGPSKGGHWTHKREFGDGNIYGGGGRTEEDFGSNNPNSTGRYPANVLLSHDFYCKKVGMVKVASNARKNKGIGVGYGGGEAERGEWNGNAENGQEEMEAWDCVSGCPIDLMDAQSGQTKSGARKAGVRKGVGYGGGEGDGGPAIESSEGGASRFFQHCAFDEDDFAPSFQYCAKASGAERGEYNKHPTVKPRKLLSYLVRLVCPPGGLGLDPFCGSGTTLLAAEDEGFHFVGVDMTEEYVDIAKRRLADYQPPGTKPAKASKRAPKAQQDAPTPATEDTKPDPVQ